MTTKITVDAHAGWPVKVIKRELSPDRSTTVSATEEIVPPNTAQEFYVHSHLKIEVQEMPHE